MSYEDVNQAIEKMTAIAKGGRRRREISDEMLVEAERLKQAVRETGGMIWVNEWDGDIVERDIAVPGVWRDIRGGVSVRSWPDSRTGSIVEHNGKHWKVVVNFVHGGIGGRYVECFSVYAIIPV